VKPSHPSSHRNHNTVTGSALLPDDPIRSQFDVMCGPGGAFLIGDPATVASKMLDASDALGGVRRITFQMSSASLETNAMKRSIELLGSEVAPIVRVPAIG
jgi:alkanesulfonate monooxygenase SsuD/methylene tetrahydromethanopterin reductase-like flavin-dependent oxidoreductase (luciferase family)